MPVLMAGEKTGFALLISISLLIEILPTHINVLIIGFLFVFHRRTAFPPITVVFF